jgi:hypothetical protein
MKKLFSSILLSLSLLTFSTPALATEHTTQCQVNAVYFDQSCQGYYLESININDNKDHYIYWLFDQQTENKNITTQLKAIFLGQNVNIIWEDNDTINNIDDDIKLSLELK